jgi:hypothetical protein
VVFETIEVRVIQNVEGLATDAGKTDFLDDGELFK